MIKPGAAVIDVGITRIIDEKTGKSKLVGDVDYDNVKKVAGYITPVPGKLYIQGSFLGYLQKAY